MATSDEQVGEQWVELCDEFRRARALELEALGKTIAKKGNPSLDSLDEFDRAHKHTEDVKRRMDEFAERFRRR